MFRTILLVIAATFAVPALANCPPGQGKQHGVCKPMASKQQSVAPVAATPPLTPTAASILASIAPPVVTAAPKDFGASSQIGYGSTSNVRATRAMDAFPLKTGGGTYTDVIADATRGFVVPVRPPYAPRNDVKIARVVASCSKACVRIRDGSSGWTISDFRFSGRGVNTSPGDIPVGIGMAGATNVLIERGEISGFRTQLADAKKYANADCLSAERGDSFTARDLYLHDCTDGGIDSKADTKLDRIVVENIGHFSYRAWAHGEIGTIVSINPGKGHVQLAAATTDWHIAKLVAVGSAPLVVIDSKGKGGRIVVDKCDLRGWTGKTLVGGVVKGATVTLGTGCTAR